MNEMLITGKIDAALEELRKPESVAAAWQRSAYQDEAGLRKYIKRRFPQAKVEITKTGVLIWKKRGKVYPWVVMKAPEDGADGVFDGMLRRVAAGIVAMLRPENVEVDGGKDFKSPVRYGEGGR